MRPKKKILLAGENAVTLGILKFLLECNGYAPTVAHSDTEAYARLADGLFELMICEKPLADTEVFIREVKGLYPYMPTIFLFHYHKEIYSGYADVSLYNPTTVELLERVKIMSMRKRGPRKGSSFKPRELAIA